MKTKIIHLLFLVTAITLLSLDFPELQGTHGGVVKKAEGFYIEMKNNPDTSFSVYLLNKKLRTVSNKGISGEVKFFFPDSTTLDVPLKPVAGNAFTARVIPGYYSCKITFHVFGKEVSAAFDRESQTAQKK